MGRLTIEIGSSTNFHFLREAEDGNLVLLLWQPYPKSPEGFKNILAIYYAEMYSELVLITN